MMGLRYGTQTFSLHSKITTAIFLTLFILHTASGVFISEDEEATGEINKRDVFSGILTACRAHPRNCPTEFEQQKRKAKIHQEKEDELLRLKELNDLLYMFSLGEASQKQSEAKKNSNQPTTVPSDIMCQLNARNCRRNCKAQRKRQDKTSLWKFLLKASQPGPDADRVSPYIRGEQGVPQEGGYKLFDKLGPYWQLHRLQESR